jgi:hypothetical protein
MRDDEAHDGEDWAPARDVATLGLAALALVVLLARLI